MSAGDETFSPEDFTAEVCWEETEDYALQEYTIPRFMPDGSYLSTPFDWPVLLRVNAGWGDGIRARIELSVNRHPILRYTACGCWIAVYGSKPKFINLRAEKQWASAEQTEAIRQLSYRKRKQVLHLSRRLEEAKEALAVLETHFGHKPASRKTYSGDFDDYL